jgi:hypothetical protein
VSVFAVIISFKGAIINDSVDKKISGNFLGVFNLFSRMGHSGITASGFTK